MSPASFNVVRVHNYRRSVLVPSRMLGGWQRWFFTILGCGGGSA